MARVTIDNCLEIYPNRFELINAAVMRTKQLLSGHEPKIEVGNDKPTVTALREIAYGIQPEDIEEETFGDWD